MGLGKRAVPAAPSSSIPTTTIYGSIPGCKTCLRHQNCWCPSILAECGAIRWALGSITWRTMTRNALVR